MTRFGIQLTTFLFLAIAGTFQSDYGLESDKNKALYGYIFANKTTSSIAQCLQLCLANCLCKSFQICHKTECQLCSSNKYLKPAAMRDNGTCSTFNFKSPIQTEVQVSANQCGTTCPSPPINCCITSNPCHHGGICVPLISNVTHRYTCKCPRVHRRGDRCEKLDCSVGYRGKSCEQPVKSCKDVVNKTSGHLPPPGIYTILTKKFTPFQAYCDFDKDIFNLTFRAWTLVQSYALRENENFIWTPLWADSSQQRKTEPNWQLHRLGIKKMNRIKEESTKWRITCCYDTTDGVDHSDYVRGSISEVDIVNFEGEQCVKVEYISIRGQSCSDCMAHALQLRNAIFHFPSQRENCGFQATGFKSCPGIANGPVKFESNFGFYGCANEQHRCSSNPNATTQTWFGDEQTWSILPPKNNTEN